MRPISLRKSTEASKQQLIPPLNFKMLPTN